MGTELDTEYEYAPLASENELRIFVLEPDDDINSRPRGSIIHCSRLAEPDYDAVSYFWGRLESDHELYIDDHVLSFKKPRPVPPTSAVVRPSPLPSPPLSPAETMISLPLAPPTAIPISTSSANRRASRPSTLKITANVDELLRHLRHASKRRYLWIDAICLNQKDKVEKAEQVPLMKDIYKNADKVHIWLGLDDDDDDGFRAFKILKRIERASGPCLPKEDDEDANCLARLFKRPWFGRRWVIQEFSLAHNAIFHCGRHSLTQEWIIPALDKIRQKVSWYGCNMLLSAAEYKEPRHQPELLSLLWNFHQSKCDRELDRVWAIRGLVSDTQWPSILKYEEDMPWQMCYWDLAEDFIDRNDNKFAYIIITHLFEFGSIRSPTQPGIRLPSWVPDWSQKRHRLFPARFPNSGLSKETNESYKCLSGLFEEIWQKQALGKKRKKGRSRRSSGLASGDNDILCTNAGNCAAWIKDWDAVPMNISLSDNKEHALEIECNPLLFIHGGGEVDCVLSLHVSPYAEGRTALKDAEVMTMIQRLNTFEPRGCLPLEVCRLLVSPEALNISDAAAAAAAAAADGGDGGDSQIPTRTLPSADRLWHILTSCQDSRMLPGGEERQFLNDTVDLLVQKSLVRVKTPGGGFFYALGPPNAERGDFILPLVVDLWLDSSDLSPKICLRPIRDQEDGSDTEGAETWGERIETHFLGPAWGFHLRPSDEPRWAASVGSETDPFSIDNKCFENILISYCDAVNNSLPGAFAFGIQ